MSIKINKVSKLNKINNTFFINFSSDKQLTEVWIGSENDKSKIKLESFTSIVQENNVTFYNYDVFYNKSSFKLYNLTDKLNGTYFYDEINHRYTHESSNGYCRKSKNVWGIYDSSHKLICQNKYANDLPSFEFDLIKNNESNSSSSSSVSSIIQTQKPYIVWERNIKENDEFYLYETEQNLFSSSSDSSDSSNSLDNYGIKIEFQDSPQTFHSYEGLIFHNSKLNIPSLESFPENFNMFLCFTENIPLTNSSSDSSSSDSSSSDSYQKVSKYFYFSKDDFDENKKELKVQKILNVLGDKKYIYDATVDIIIEQKQNNDNEEESISNFYDEAPLDANNVMPLTFIAEENSSVMLIKHGEYTGGILYKTISSISENDNWLEYRSYGSEILLNKGEWVQFKNTNNTLSTSNQDYFQFQITGKVSTSGDIQSLLNYYNSCTKYCYYKLFEGCESLINSPCLSSKILADNCYESMFEGCKNLSCVQAEFIYWNQNIIQLDDSSSSDSSSDLINNEVAIDIVDATKNWLYGVSEQGVFKCEKKLDTISIERNANTVPSTWNVINKDDNGIMPLTFIAEEDESSIQLVKNVEQNNYSLQYKLKNDQNWSTYNVGEKITLNKYDFIQFKKQVFDSSSSDSSSSDDLLNDSSSSESEYIKFVMEGKISASGNIQSLLNYSDSCTEYCYYRLFEDCTSLIKAPELPATTLSDYCYANMFKGCTSLVKAPELPATILYKSCYESMFEGCTSLIKSPKLPAKFLVNSCYDNMFNGCKNLSYVQADFIDWEEHVYENSSSSSDSSSSDSSSSDSSSSDSSSSDSSSSDSSSSDSSSIEDLYKVTLNWLYGVSEQGVFKCSQCLDTISIERNANTIISSWKIETKSPTLDYNGIMPLTFTAKENESTVELIRNGKYNNGILYKTSTLNYWKKCFINQNEQSFIIDLSKQGEWVQFKNTNNTLSTSNQDYFQFVMTGKISASGDIQSLLNYSDSCTGYCYYRLFENCESLVTAPELSATTLSGHCYDYMFNGCQNLSQIQVGFTKWNDEEDATTLNWLNGVSGQGIFKCPKDLDDSKIDESHIPLNWNIINKDDKGIMPLTFIAEKDGSTIELVKQGSFEKELEYKTKDTNWTDYIFGNGKENNYLIRLSKGDWVQFRTKSESEFFSSSATEYIKFEMTGEISASGNIQSLLNYSNSCTAYCYYALFEGCESLVTAPELPATTLSNNCYERMFYGCTSLVKAPELPATILYESCYESMFEGCISLNYIKVGFVDWEAHVYENSSSSSDSSSSDSSSIEDSSSSDSSSIEDLYKATKNWLNGVSQKGVFECHNELNFIKTDERNSDNIPGGWGVYVSNLVKETQNQNVIFNNIISLYQLKEFYYSEKLDIKYVKDIHYINDENVYPQFSFHLVHRQTDKTINFSKMKLSKLQVDTTSFADNLVNNTDPNRDYPFNVIQGNNLIIQDSESGESASCEQITSGYKMTVIYDDNEKKYTVKMPYGKSKGQREAIIIQPKTDGTSYDDVDGTYYLLSYEQVMNDISSYGIEYSVKNGEMEKVKKDEYVNFRKVYCNYDLSKGLQNDEGKKYLIFQYFDGRSPSYNNSDYCHAAILIPNKSNYFDSGIQGYYVYNYTNSYQGSYYGYNLDKKTCYGRTYSSFKNVDAFIKDSIEFGKISDSWETPLVNQYFRKVTKQPQIPSHGTNKDLYLRLTDIYGIKTNVVSQNISVYSQIPEKLSLKLYGSNGNVNYTGFYKKYNRFFPSQFVKAEISAFSPLKLKYQIYKGIGAIQSNKICQGDFRDDSYVEYKVLKLHLGGSNSILQQTSSSIECKFTLKITDEAGNIAISYGETLFFKNLFRTKNFPLVPESTQNQILLMRTNQNGEGSDQINKKMISTTQFIRSWNQVWFPETHGLPLNNKGEIDETEALRISKRGDNVTSVQRKTYGLLALDEQGKTLIKDNDGRYVQGDWEQTKVYESMLNKRIVNGSFEKYWIIDNTGNVDFKLQFEVFDFSNKITQFPANFVAPADGDMLAVYDASDKDATEQYMDENGNTKYRLINSSKLKLLFLVKGSGLGTENTITMLNSNVDGTLTPVERGFISPSIAQCSRVCLVPFSDSGTSSDSLGSGFKLKAGPKHALEYQNYDCVENNGQFWVHEAPLTANGDWRSCDYLKVGYKYYVKNTSINYENGTISFEERLNKPLLGTFNNYLYLKTDKNAKDYCSKAFSYFNEKKILLSFASTQDDIVDYSEPRFCAIPIGIQTNYNKNYDREVDLSSGKLYQGMSYNKDIGILTFNSDEYVPKGRIFGDYVYHTYYRLTSDGYGDLFFYGTGILVPHTETNGYKDWTYVDLKITNEGTNTLQSGTLQFLARGYVTKGSVVDTVIDNNRPWDIQKGTTAQTVLRTGAKYSMSYSTLTAANRGNAFSATGSQTCVFGTLEPKHSTYVRVFWCIANNAEGTSWIDCTKGAKTFSAQLSGMYYVFTS